MAEAYYSTSSYAYVLNNPVGLIDPNGMFAAPPSTHTDELGNVIAEYDDGDNGVYVHSNSTSAADIDNQRNNGANTGGDGNYIGELGGEIDVTSIYANILEQNGEEAEGHFGESISPLLKWGNLVKFEGEWDLKNNEATIFGVAWKFDHSDSKGENKTIFTFGEMKGNAADFGNHHAGYTGTMVGIPTLMQKIGAGVFEQKKKGTLLKTFIFTNQHTHPPYMDAQKDYEYNTAGMKLAKQNQ